MAGVRIKPKVNRTKLQRKLLDLVGNEKTKRGINQIIADMVKPYVPYKSGSLRESVQVGPKTIAWRKVYARYQYYGEVYGPNFPIMSGGKIVGWYSRPGEKKHPTGRELGLPGEWKGWTFGYTTPGTKHHWLDEMMMYDKRAMQLRITNYLKRRAKELGK